MFVTPVCIKLLLSLQKADVCLAPMTVNSDRQLVVDFSKPYLDYTMSLILAKPDGDNINFFAFLKPFQTGLWLATLGVVS